jgi:hypothetical protein
MFSLQISKELLDSIKGLTLQGQLLKEMLINPPPASKGLFHHLKDQTLWDQYLEILFNHILVYSLKDLNLLDQFQKGMFVSLSPVNKELFHHLTLLDQ